MKVGRCLRSNALGCVFWRRATRRQCFPGGCHQSCVPVEASGWTHLVRNALLACPSRWGKVLLEGESGTVSLCSQVLLLLFWHLSHTDAAMLHIQPHIHIHIHHH